MRFLKLSTLILSLVFLVSCGGELARSEKGAGTAAPQTQVAEQQQKSLNGDVKMQPVSLKQADQSDTVAQAVERKIIKDAELTLEVPSPTEAQRKVTSIAEANNGFVVTSESKQRQSSDGSQHLLDITLVTRVPASRFGAALDQIRAISNNITAEKQTGQDVTEEFIDLEAHIRTQKALEAQFLEIMKQAHKVEDLLEVQRQIAGVRAEIEKLEGRKRFLENRSSLSTITVNLNSAGTGIVVNTSGFGRSIKEAVGDSIDVGGAIILFLIRFVIVMIPVFLLLILPIGLVARYFVRRAQRFRLAREMTGGPPPPIQAT
jgi:hypothetical protein